MTSTIYPSTSPYRDTDLYDGKYLGIMNARNFPALADDILYVLPEVYQYRPDLLAQDLYDDSKLWWVFAARNPNKLGPDPYFNFVKGVEFYVPKLDVLKQYLGI